MVIQTLLSLRAFIFISFIFLFLWNFFRSKEKAVFLVFSFLCLQYLMLKLINIYYIFTLKFYFPREFLRSTHLEFLGLLSFLEENGSNKHLIIFSIPTIVLCNDFLVTIFISFIFLNTFFLWIKIVILKVSIFVFSLFHFVFIFFFYKHLKATNSALVLFDYGFVIKGSLDVYNIVKKNCISKLQNDKE